jgi:hypothetical protein
VHPASVSKASARGVFDGPASDLEVVGGFCQKGMRRMLHDRFGEAGPMQSRPDFWRARGEVEGHFRIEKVGGTTANCPCIQSGSDECRNGKAISAFPRINGGGDGTGHVL